MAFDMLSKVPGLRPVKPTAAMYFMVRSESDCCFARD